MKDHQSAPADRSWVVGEAGSRHLRPGAPAEVIEAFLGFPRSGEAPAAPEVFYASLGGFAGPYREVRREGEKLIYCVYHSDHGVQEKREFRPSQEAWRVFWDGLEEAEVWRWEASYCFPVLEAVFWSVALAYQGRRVISSGQSAFPGSAIPYREGRLFKGFRRAVQGLLEEVEF